MRENAARPSEIGRTRPGILLLLALFLVLIGWRHLAELSSLPRQLPQSWADDARHLRQGFSLMNGDGLGPYDADTLRDRPGFALFLARCHQLGIEDRQALGLLDLLFVVLLARFLLRLGLAPGLVASAALVALFTPALLGELAERLAPEQLHARLAGLAVALALQALLADRPDRRLLFLAGTGLMLGLDVITEEHWARVLPLVLLVLGATWRRDRRTGATTLVATGRVLIALILLALPVWLAAGRIVDGNDREHGLALLSDEDEPGFEAALGALQRIARAQDGGRLDRDLRARLYRLSPTLARLEPALESDLFSGPTDPTDHHGRPAALLRRTVREGARRIGVYESAAGAAAFYGQIATELNAAVDAGEVEGLKYRLDDDRPPFPLAAFGLVWLRLGELWSLGFEDVLPGAALARIELDRADLDRARCLLGEERPAEPADETRARARSGRRLLYQRALPGLALLAVIGLFLRLRSLRGRGLDQRLVAELVLVVGLGLVLLSLCAEEAAWLRDRGRGYLLLHLLFPFWLALGIDHHLTDCRPLLSPRQRRVTAVLLQALAGLGGIALVLLPGLAAEGRARTLVAGPEWIAILGDARATTTMPGAFTLPGADGEPLRLHPRVDSDGPGARLLVLEAEVFDAPLGAAYELDWEGPARDERGATRRQLFVKEPGGRNRWEIAVRGRRVGELSLRSAENPGLVFRPTSLGFAALERRFAAGPDPLPEVEAWRPAPDRIHIRLRGGERESRYRFYFSAGLAPEPRVYPERQGELWLSAEGGLHCPDDADLTVELLTDAAGNGELETRLECREEPPATLYTQGLGTQHFSKDAVLCRPDY
ncbi:MAG: hypothetical protein H6807_03580 [Planctomycetes bacterium]|nr:hypothetical protein [Planctomycetota bacterium]